MFNKDKENNLINIDTSQNLESSNYKYKVISLFSGAGGKDLGVIGDFNIFNKHYSKNNFEIVYANDIVNHTCQTYNYNFDHNSHNEDIRNVNLNDLPSADIVIGGFSCQDFSVAGTRQGFDSERGLLYLQMKRVIDHIKPKAFVAENVEGLTGVRKNIRLLVKLGVFL